MSALPSGRTPVVHVNDARTTIRGLAFVVVPGVVLLLVASALLRTSPDLVPVLVAGFVALAGILLVLFFRGPAVTRG